MRSSCQLARGWRESQPSAPRGVARGTAGMTDVYHGKYPKFSGTAKHFAPAHIAHVRRGEPFTKIYERPRNLADGAVDLDQREEVAGILRLSDEVDEGL